ncbi:MarP family serine protease [Solirubrobacter sp. CPCC 204708]|uniref:MarP family serine protease n=1 Tax=Solirubrobacter deserti TaxID=2282478 RepID=A0ABT4RU19_9ACTN|nr:MarP family serine protease [Solirubrobacter deserti]MBE2318455.1 MarP family serine protease [Solirubrobacter deserti]MDA0141771.1 MarP family serine protease [Solirubrobacter deserti]
MTGIDWLIVGVIVLLGLFGWAQGFVAGALALLGFAVGAWLGTRIGPLVLEEGRRSPWSPAFALVGALIAGMVFAIGFEGLGARLRGRVRSPAATALDGFLGSVLTACVGIGIVWVLGALALANGGDARREVQRSTILQAINTVMPPSSGLLDTLARLDPFPRIDGPEARVPAPTAGIARAEGVRAAAASVVKILGNACGLGVEGSGWVAGDGLVVTNAHVIAGQEDTRVFVRGREPGLDAVAVSFDPRNDLAILRVNGLDAPALTLASNPRSGTSAAILGFPGNGPYDVRAGRVGQTREVITQDAYGQGPVRRSITSLRGAVRSGNSGGPMVDKDGQVVTTVFAATTSGPRGGFGVPNAIARAALERARVSNGVSTGPCTG